MELAGKKLIGNSLAVCLLAILGLPAWAEPHYIAERQQGLVLVQSGKHAEAAAFFVRLAGTARKPEQKADALRQAALATARDRRIEEALRLADQIPLPPESHFTKILIYQEARKWAELLKAAEPFDQEAWPDSLIYPTLMARARARSILGERAAAESDVLEAIRHTVSPVNQAAAWHQIAQMAQRDAPDNAKALRAYGEMIRIHTGGGGMLQRALSERARLLSSLGKHDAALADLAELEKNNPSRDPHWVCTALLGYGEVYRNMGDKARARQHFQEAARVPGASPALLDEVKKQLSELDQ